MPNGCCKERFVHCFGVRAPYGASLCAPLSRGSRCVIHWERIVGPYGAGSRSRRCLVAQCWLINMFLYDKFCVMFLCCVALLSLSPHLLLVLDEEQSELMTSGHDGFPSR